MKRPRKTTASAQHLSHDDVAHLVGDLDDSVIAAILATGADYSEIELALKWLGAGAEEPRMDGQGLTPRAELVCDILLESGAFENDNAARDARK